MNKVYTLKYKTGAVHIAGLDEVLRGGEFNYSLSACGALSRSNFWATGKSSEDLAEVVKAAQYVGKGLCKKCAKTAQAVLDKA